MSHVVLGLLMLWPQSLYELTKSFESGVSLFYSSSTGSIKRALDRLLAEGMIRVESEGGARGKRVYVPTEAGRAAFFDWMRAGSEDATSEAALLTRSYFLGLLAPEDRPAVTAGILASLRDGLRRLERLRTRIEGQTIPPGLEDVARYQFATLEYGLATHRAAVLWAENLPPS